MEGRRELTPKTLLWSHMGHAMHMCTDAHKHVPNVMEINHTSIKLRSLPWEKHDSGKSPEWQLLRKPNGGGFGFLKNSSLHSVKPSQTESYWKQKDKIISKSERRVESYSYTGVWVIHREQNIKVRCGEGRGWTVKRLRNSPCRNQA